MENSTPRISVVTPSYNQAEYLEQTIESILGQDYPNLEYIIIDGGSDDGTASIIDKYRDRLAYVVSEPDGGQSNAINKGFARATGDILAWLNSDDVYLPGALKSVADAFDKHPEASVIYGDVDIIDARGRVLKRRRDIPFDFDMTLFGVSAIMQPEVFLRRYVYEAVGGVDESFHMQMDKEWWLRISKAGFRFVHIPVRVAALRWHSVSKSISQGRKNVSERHRLREMYWNKSRLWSAEARKWYGRGLSIYYRLKRQVLKVGYYGWVDFLFPTMWKVKRGAG